MVMPINPIEEETIRRVRNMGMQLGVEDEDLDDDDDDDIDDDDE